MADTGTAGGLGGSLLFLTDEQLRKGIEAMYFAYRGFTSDPDRILEDYAYGRAHHRALHFVNRAPGTTVTNLLAILGVTKQSLNRVLRTADRRRPGGQPRRPRPTSASVICTLTRARGWNSSEDAVRRSDALRMRAGIPDQPVPDAVTGFRKVLEAMMDAGSAPPLQRAHGPRRR